jgi:hypothetical protein
VIPEIQGAGSSYKGEEIEGFSGPSTQKKKKKKKHRRFKAK